MGITYVVVSAAVGINTAEHFNLLCSYDFSKKGRVALKSIVGLQATKNTWS